MADLHNKPDTEYLGSPGLSTVSQELQEVNQDSQSQSPIQDGTFKSAAHTQTGKSCFLHIPEPSTTLDCEVRGLELKEMTSESSSVFQRLIQIQCGFSKLCKQKEILD